MSSKSSKAPIKQGTGEDDVPEVVVEDETHSFLADDLDSVSAQDTSGFEIDDMMILMDAEAETDSGNTRSSTHVLSNESASVVAVVSSFLLVQPYGATMESINAYLQSVDCSVSADSVHAILKQLPMVFSLSHDDNGEERYRLSAFGAISSPLEEQ